MQQDTYDLAIIGSGPGGYKAAITAAQLGARVALIERNEQGGTCLNKGCIPKNTLLHLAKLMEDVKALNGFGIHGDIQGDFAAALLHKENVISDIRNSFPIWLKKLGVHIFHGHAHLNTDGTIDVSDPGEDSLQTIQSNKIIIATGSKAIEHPACKVDGTRILDSYHFLTTLQDLPESILCVGGGAIGTEFAFLLHQFGAQVTIAENSDRLLNQDNIPERASVLLERKFRRLGVDVLKNIDVTEVTSTDNGVEVTFSDQSRHQYSHVLVAIGRSPLTDGLGLENVGVNMDDAGFIVTNSKLETSTHNIYAIGDVKRGPMTANSALHDGKIAASNAVRNTHLTVNYHIVPIVIDSALEIAAVGLTEEMAENAGFSPDVARGNFTGSPKARGRLDYEGFIEVVHDEETGQMLGGCIVGPEAGEQIQMLTAACQSPRGLWLFTDINYSHPSWCEELEHAIYPYINEFSQSEHEIFQPGIYARHNQ